VCSKSRRHWFESHGRGAPLVDELVQLQHPTARLSQRRAPQSGSSLRSALRLAEQFDFR
jgi:hypothetical protein